MTNSTGAPNARSTSIIRQTQPGELPARRRVEEIPVARARMARGRRMRAAAQDHLVDHEFAVVLAERAFGRAVAGIGRVGAARPLPNHAEGIVDEIRAR